MSALTLSGVTEFEAEERADKLLQLYGLYGKTSWQGWKWVQSTGSLGLIGCYILPHSS